MKLGKLLGGAFKAIAPFAVPIITQAIAGKVIKLGDKVVTKATKPRP